MTAAFDPLTIDCDAIGTAGTPDDRYRTRLANLIRNEYTAYTPEMVNVRINGGGEDAAIGSPPGESTGPFPPFQWTGVYLTLDGWLSEDSSEHADAFQAWSFVGGVIEQSCFGVADPGPYPSSRRPNSLVIIKSDFQAADGSDQPVGDITIRDSVFDLRNGNGYNATIYIRDSGSDGAMPSTLWQRRPQMISFVNVYFIGGTPSVSTGFQDQYRALFVRTIDERDAAIARQVADPSVIGDRIADRAASGHTCSPDCADARTWIVWEAYDEDRNPIPPPDGYYTDVG